MTSDPFDDLFRDFDVMNRRFESMFSNLMNRDDVRTYGYTMYQGPDGIPHVHEYGNDIGENDCMIGEGRDPFTDVTENGDKVIVTMEIPGVKKEDINLEGGKNSVTISVTGPKNFEKTVSLPCDADIDSAAATYNNGILEVTLRSLKQKPKGKKIDIC